MKKPARQPEADQTVHRKRVEFDPETWHALDLYARESMRSFQELMDEAVRDLLRKHDRPVTLKEALRRSTPAAPAAAGAPAGKSEEPARPPRKRRSRAA